MGKASKSKRFSHQGAASVRKHAERFPYRARLSDVDQKSENTDNHTLGGF